MELAIKQAERRELVLFSNLVEFREYLSNYIPSNIWCPRINIPRMNPTGSAGPQMAMQTPIERSQPQSTAGDPAIPHQSDRTAGLIRSSESLSSISRHVVPIAMNHGSRV
jgi:hypothetical protein